MARDMTPVLKRCRVLELTLHFLVLIRSLIEMLELVESRASMVFSSKRSRKRNFIYGVLEKPFQKQLC